VPVFWAEKAANLTRQAAVKAGIPEKSLILINECEAAACFSANLYDECGLRGGDPFLLCVAGGGTVVNSLFYAAKSRIWPHIEFYQKIRSFWKSRVLQQERQLDRVISTRNLYICSSQN
jgi:hypothetical protein